MGSLPHPLVYVVTELRIPFAPRLARQDTAEKLQEVLPELPVLRPEKRQRVSGGGGNLEIQLEDAWRFIDMNQSTSLIISSSAIVYETTRYPGFEKFISSFTSYLGRITALAPIAGYERIGLRYVNEIWPSDSVDSIQGWRAWIAPDLIDTFTASEAQIVRSVSGDLPELRNLETNLDFSLQSNCSLTVRISTLTGNGVVGNAPLKRWTSPSKPGNFCVIDFDGYWPRKADGIQTFSDPEVVEMLKTVHAPVKSGFAWATTSELRKEAGILDD